MKVAEPDSRRDERVEEIKDKLDYYPNAFWLQRTGHREDARDDVRFLLARLTALEQQNDRIREAMGGYPDSDLVSLATTLKARDKRYEEVEQENERFKTILNEWMCDKITVKDLEDWCCNNYDILTTPANLRTPTSEATDDE